MADVYSSCGCGTKCGDAPDVRVVAGNDLTVEAVVSVWDAKECVYVPMDLTGASDVALNMVTTFTKVPGEGVSASGSRVSAFFPAGRLGKGVYGVEITFRDADGRCRAFERSLIEIVESSGEATVESTAEGETGDGLNITVDVRTRTVRIGGTGATDYPSLTGKPSINGVVLEGNKTPEELGMYSKEEPDSELSETSENCVQNRVVTRAIRELQDYCFPTSLEASISPSSAEWTGNSVEVSVSFKVLRNSKPVVADTVQIQFNGETKSLEKVAEGTEKFVLSAQGHKSGSVTAKKDSTAIKNSPRPISVNLYLPVYYGFSKATTGNELTIASLTKGGASLNGTRTLTNDDTTKYLWLCVPNTMSINKVTSSGFDVPFLAPVEASTPLGTYKCYRTQDLPGVGSMTIVIS